MVSAVFSSSGWWTVGVFGFDVSALDRLVVAIAMDVSVCEAVAVERLSIRVEVLNTVESGVVTVRLPEVGVGLENPDRQLQC